WRSSSSMSARTASPPTWRGRRTGRWCSSSTGGRRPLPPGKRSPRHSPPRAIVSSHRGSAATAPAPGPGWWRTTASTVSSRTCSAWPPRSAPSASTWLATTGVGRWRGHSLRSTPAGCVRSRRCPRHTPQPCWRPCPAPRRPCGPPTSPCSRCRGCPSGCCSRRVGRPCGSCSSAAGWTPSGQPPTWRPWPSPARSRPPCRGTGRPGRRPHSCGRSGGSRCRRSSCGGAPTPPSGGPQRRALLPTSTAPTASWRSRALVTGSPSATRPTSCPPSSTTWGD
ncbi:MAG: Epoxide hydrolase, partial [uncultured Acidimicrobiales bacterium]